MQNVVNYLCPFFRDRLPIVNGRVYFVKPDTSAITFTDIAGLDGADFVTVKDRNGTPLENPLSLDSEGRFSVQPFVDDGVDFKMIVCYPTGVPAELHDNSMTYDVAYTINSFAQDSENVSIGGVATVDSLADLRQLAPTVKTALVRGYSAAGDFCPPRVFNWISSIMTDNNGTQIRSSVQGYTNTGTWVCTPSGFVDVRWFGIDPESGSDYTSIILALAQEFTGLPIYFPYGSYFLSSHVAFKSVILERLALFYPVDSASTDICFAVENTFDNRGGRFERNETHCVYPKVKGVLRTSWLSSPIDPALAPSTIGGVDEIIFDATKNISSSVTVDSKRVLVKNGVTVSASITFSPSCTVFYETSGKLTAGQVKVGESWNLLPNKTDLVDELRLKKGNENLVKYTRTLITFLVESLFGAGLGLDSSNYWKVVSDPQNVWNGLLALVADRANIGSLLSTNSILQNTLIRYGTIACMMRLDDGCTVMVDDGYMTYLDEAQSRTAISDNTILVKNILDHYDNPEVSLINIVIIKSANVFSAENFRIQLPEENSNVVVHVSNLNNRGLVISEEDASHTPTVSTKVLGCSSSDVYRVGAGPDRVILRQPTIAERNRYGIDSSVHWIIDPLYV